MKLKPGQAMVLIHLLLLGMLVMPFLLYEDLFNRFAEVLLSGQHALLVFLATVALLTADVLIPVPSSAISVSAGMLLSLPAAFLACFLGLSGSAFVGYGFGYFFRRLYFERWYTDDEFRQLSTQLSRHGAPVLLLCRGIPILAEMSVMVAGFHRYPFARFSAVVTLGNLVLAVIYSFLGTSIEQSTSIYLFAAAFLAVPFITFSLRLWWLRRVAD